MKASSMIGVVSYNKTDGTWRCDTHDGYTIIRHTKEDLEIAMDRWENTNRGVALFLDRMRNGYAGSTQ